MSSSMGLAFRPGAWGGNMAVCKPNSKDGQRHSPSKRSYSAPGARDGDDVEHEAREVPEVKELVNLVLEGGGVKGIALAGAIEELDRHGYEFNLLVGTSAGSMVAALLGAGYTPKELAEIIAGPEIEKIADASRLSYIPVIGRPLGAILSLATRLGVYKGDFLLEFLRKKLLEKGVRTFRDLIAPGNEGEKDPRYRYRVHVIAADITRGRMLVLPDDVTVEHYGVAPDDLEVALAVRMSVSVPFVFRPVRLKGRNGVVSYIVDGGLLSNFPVWFFDDRDMFTIGVRILQNRQHELRFPYIAHMTYALASTAVEAHDIHAATRFDRKKWGRTVEVNTANVSIFEFKLTPLQKETLYEAGRRTMELFLPDVETEKAERAARFARMRERAAREGGAGE
ncbi:patatin-like phospholipase family protein [Sorangium sp. So ce1128]